MNAEKEYIDFIKRELGTKDRMLHFKQQQISSLLELTRNVNQNVPSEALFRMFENILLAQIGVKRMLMFVFNGVNWKISAAVDCSQEDLGINPVQLQSIRTVSNVGDLDLPLLSNFEIVIPVRHKQDFLAFLLLGPIEAGSAFDKEDKLTFIQTITNTVVVANENKRMFKAQYEQQLIQKDMQLAAEIQKMLIASRLPQNRNLQAAGIYKPHHDIGGDYYDLIELNEDEFVMCIADISGKGVSAAMLMSNFQASLRILAKQGKPLTEIVEDLNNKVHEIAHGDKYITFFIAHYKAKSRELHYINAGHQHPLLLNGKESIWLKEGSMFLGVFEPLPVVKQGLLKMEENALLVMFTDGLTDVPNLQGDMYDADDLQPHCEEHRHLEPDAFNQRLLEQIDKFRGLQDTIDDVSVLTVRFP